MILENSKKWLTVHELANYLDLTPKAIYNRVHLKQLPYTKLGGSLRFNREAIDQYMENNSVQPFEMD